MIVGACGRQSLLDTVQCLWLRKFIGNCPMIVVVKVYWTRFNDCGRESILDTIQ